MEKPLILLTGATGFIGSHLLPPLTREARVRCVVRPSSVSRLPRLEGVEVAAADLTETRALQTACEGVDAILHMGALLRTAGPEAVEAVNVGATRVLVEEALRRNIRHFVYLSTENALRTDLSDSYPDTKRRAEAQVRRLPHHLILRPCFIYGKGDHHGVGRMVDALKALPVIPLFGGLSAAAQPVYVDDLVQMLLAACRRRVEGEFVVAGVEAHTLNQVLRLAASAAKWKRWFVPVPKWAWRALAVMMDRWHRGAGWGESQMNNIYGAVWRDPEPAIRAFGVRPRGLRAGLETWLAPHPPS